MSKLPLQFYNRDDVVLIAKELIGKVLCTNINNRITKGIITETEAYAGVTDKASHAYGNRRTNRTEVMYGKPGISYVYLCYGVHSLFNVVTNKEGIPHAVLIRSIHPVDGLDTIRARRGRKQLLHKLADGPGKVCSALGIKFNLHNRIDLKDEKIWIEDSDITVEPTEIITGPRIGVEYAKEDALLPYRFLWKTP
ncbi:MAG: DNA-3-methyladenine glycosylase [Flavobacteriales bacterium]|nr:DNA-3-methyladenine glycosylase [Flavobacteriales bacterium]